MPGCFAQQMAQSGARVAEFDRLVPALQTSTRGAVEMVETLFATPGAGQDTDLWKLASDIEADQGSEIARMLVMLESRPPS